MAVPPEGIADSAREQPSRGSSPPGRKGPSRAFVALVLAAALLGVGLRLWAVLAIPTVPVSDFWSYLHRAISLHEVGLYEPKPGQPNAFFPPGYPLLLAASFAVSHDYLLAAKVVNCLLGAASIILAGLLGRRLGGEKAGVVAAFILALYPRSILVCCLVASENLFTPLLLGFVLLVGRGLAGRRALTWAAMAGVVLGVLTGTRIVARYLGLIWPFAALVLRRRPLRTVALETVILIAVQHTVLLPWAFWNLRWQAKFTFATSIGGVALFEANSNAATGEWFEWRHVIEARVPGAMRLPPFDLDALLFRESFRWIEAHPGKAVAGYVRRFAVLFAHDAHAADWAIFGSGSPPEPPTDVLPGAHALKRHPTAVKWVLEWPSWVLLLASAGGVVWLLAGMLKATQPGLREATFAAVSSAAAYQVVLVPIFITLPRYRWPIEDLLVPVAAAALCGLGALIRTLARPGGTPL
jgi:4-amino-4-deoxy-L-arabinose transferase-like glycosyltransferase